jgi:hypothetical protein
LGWSDPKFTAFIGKGTTVIFVVSFEKVGLPIPPIANVFPVTNELVVVFPDPRNVVELNRLFEKVKFGSDVDTPMRGAKYPT